MRCAGAACPAPRVELVAVADRDLSAGEELTLGAGHGVDSLEPRLLPPQRMESDGFVPYYLAAGHVMARDVKKGEILRLDDVLVPRDTVLFKLRQQQEAVGDDEWVEAELALVEEAARL